MGKAAKKAGAKSEGADAPLKVIPSRKGLPSYWYVFPLMVGWISFLYLSGIWPYFLVYFFLYIAVCPFVSWPQATKLLIRTLQPYPGFDYYVNLNGLAMVVSRFLLLWPLETFLWYVDDLIFPAYRKTKIVKPLFVIGQPRSGTTKLENILSKDDRLVSLTLFEMRFPYLTIFYLKNYIDKIDKKYLNGGIRAFVYRHNLHYFMSATSERCKMRPLRFDRPDEDDTMFLFHQSMHFTLIAPFPAVENVRRYYHFDELPEAEQMRMMNFHYAAVQKVMYYRGEGKVYFSKWVGGWNGQLQISDKKFYKDAQYLCIVREPVDSLPSWMRLQALLAYDFVGVEVLDHPGILREIKKENIAWFKNQVDFCQSLGKDRLLTFSSEEYYKAIRKNTTQLYGHLGLEVTSEYDKVLQQEDKAQVTHVPTKTDSRHITREEIINDFPDLPRILLGKDAPARPW